MAETHKVLDCRNFPGEKPAQLPFPGRKRKFWSWQCCTPVPVHGHQNTPEFRQQLHSMLQDERLKAEAAPQPKANGDHSGKIGF
jgi:hypothetical protein